MKLTQTPMEVRSGCHRLPTLTPEMGAAMPMDYFNIGWEMDGMSAVSPMTQTGEKGRDEGEEDGEAQKQIDAAAEQWIDGWWNDAG